MRSLKLAVMLLILSQNAHASAADDFLTAFYREAESVHACAEKVAAAASQAAIEGAVVGVIAGSR